MSAPRTTTRQSKPAATKSAAKAASKRTNGKPTAAAASKPAADELVVAEAVALVADQPQPKRTRKPAAPKAPAKATARKSASKRAAAATPAAKLSTDQEDIPTDPAELRKLIKITRDRRWRASRRGDAELVHAMNVKLEALTGTPFTPDSEPAASKPATKKAVPARKR